MTTGMIIIEATAIIVGLMILVYVMSDFLSKRQVG